MRGHSRGQHTAHSVARYPQHAHEQMGNSQPTANMNRCFVSLSVLLFQGEVT